VAVTAAETAAAALVGAALGVVLYAAMLPVVAHASVAGGPWSIGDLWLGWPPLLLTLVVAPLLAAACAAVALRQVVISPLGVAQRTRTRRPRSVRLLGMAAAWGVLALAARSLDDSTTGGVLVSIMVGLGLLIGSLALVGPWITWALGAVVTRLARRPSTLLAGRRIVDDPKGAYRAISGVVLAGMTAGFLFTLGPVVERLDGRSSDDRALVAWMAPSGSGAVATTDATDTTTDSTTDTTEPAGAVAGVDGVDRRTLQQSLVDRLSAAGLDASVSVEGDEYDSGWVEVRVTPTAGTDPERIRTALAGLLDRTQLEAVDDDVFGDRRIVHDFRRASLALAIATMVLAATTTAIASSASILDQRPTLRRMRLAGTPVGTLQRARAWQSAVPLVAATLGSLATGAGAALLLLSAAGNDGGTLDTGNLTPMLGVVGVGLALALGASTVTRPLLVAATDTDVTTS
jgi:hypothetical protein